ncbi:MAG: hypothetical protein AAF585_19995 [Verrucomicrobiota bacterium]
MNIAPTFLTIIAIALALGILVIAAAFAKRLSGESGPMEFVFSLGEKLRMKFSSGKADQLENSIDANDDELAHVHGNDDQ